MSFAIIVAIVIVGLLLIFLEMFVIPGTMLFGVIGGIAIIAGVGLMYKQYGGVYGNVTAVITGALVIVSVAAGFKVIQSNRLAMKAEIKGKVNLIEHTLYSPGQKGKAVSEIKPNGKAVFTDHKVDVYSEGEYIARESQVEIVKITNNKIFVKQSKT